MPDMVFRNLSILYTCTIKDIMSEEEFLEDIQAPFSSNSKSDVKTNDISTSNENINNGKRNVIKKFLFQNLRRESVNCEVY